VARRPAWEGEHEPNRGGSLDALSNPRLLTPGLAPRRFVPGTPLAMRLLRIGAAHTPELQRSSEKPHRPYPAGPDPPKSHREMPLSTAEQASALLGRRRGLVHLRDIRVSEIECLNSSAPRRAASL
jgi:hypothetical protein